jgi:hypothetical protein
MVRSTRSTNRRQKLETGVDSMTVTLPDAAAIIRGVIPRISRASRGIVSQDVSTLDHQEPNLKKIPRSFLLY